MAVAFETLGADTATSSGTAITAGLNVFSAWTNIGTSSIAGKLMWIFFTWSDGTPLVVEFGTGAAPSAPLFQLVHDRKGAAGSASGGGVLGPISIDIASGIVYSLRVEGDSVAAGSEATAWTILIANERIPDITSGLAYASYGIVTGADGKGTAIDPGGTAHTEGAWVEITPGSAAQADIQEVHFNFGNNGNSAMTAATWLADIGLDGSTAIITDILLAASTTGDEVQPEELILPGNVFAGQRIYVRSRCSIIDATDRLHTAQVFTVAGTVAAGGSGGGMRLAGHGGLAS